MKQGLLDRGVNFIIEGRELRPQCHDYRRVDAVLTFRDFDENQWAWKPATKLYNVWLAEVPVILNSEPAFRSLRKTPLDYIEVNNAEEIIKAVL